MMTSEPSPSLVHLENDNEPPTPLSMNHPEADPQEHTAPLPKAAAAPQEHTRSSTLSTDERSTRAHYTIARSKHD